MFQKNKQYYKFCFYGFLKNLRFFDAFFILFLRDRGLSYTEIGSLYAFREIFINVIEIPSGIIADTYGRKNTLVFSFISYIASFVIFFSANTYWLFFLAFVLFGLGDAFRSGTHKGMIMDYLRQKNWENQKINYYGHTRACSQRGSAISALIAGSIVFYSGNYQSIFLASIIPYLINLLLILSYPKELNISSKKGEKSIKKSIQNLWLSIKKPKILSIVHTSAIYSAYLKSIKDYIQPVMLQVVILIPISLHTNALKQNSFFIGVMYFILYLFTAFASSISAKIEKKNSNNIAFISLLIGFSLGMFNGWFYQHNYVVLSLIVFGMIYIVENIRKPILTGFLANETPNKIIASVLSAQSLYRSLITSLLALGFGYASDVFGIGYAFLIVSGFLLFITLLFNRKN